MSAAPENINLDNGSLAGERARGTVPGEPGKVERDSFQKFEERLLKAGIRISISRLHWMLA
ncbi:MAG: hypothetical protein IKH39_01970 [Candidatus Methanomethylophilaceae archaeon]|nr:hypothetical protein [Candidatus Methanomethylophilaceae archaeon]MBR4181743.1 hypothetical protein [Candidatus Methanomethylophilaceae archaeon]